MVGATWSPRRVAPARLSTESRAERRAAAEHLHSGRRRV